MFGQGTLGRSTLTLRLPTDGQCQPQGGPTPDATALQGLLVCEQCLPERLSYARL